MKRPTEPDAPPARARSALARAREPRPLAGAEAPRRQTRRLEDKMLVVFHHACDVKDLEVADNILRLLEMMLARRPIVTEGNRRRTIESLVAAYERLWHIRHHEVG